MTDFEALSAMGHANDLQAALDRALAGQCPTKCEEDCQAACHEGHKPDPGHDPSTCPGFLNQELQIQRDRHAPFGDLFEAATRWQRISILSTDAAKASRELTELFADKLEQIEQIAKSNRVWTADIDGTRRAEGWNMAMSAILLLVDSPPDGYEEVIARAEDIQQRMAKEYGGE